MHFSPKTSSALFLGVAALLVFACPVYAQKQSEPHQASNPINHDGIEDPYKIEDPYEMNGIRLADYAGFPQKWKLVTVRFRTDNGEQRFVYANDVAYKSLLEGVTDYPEGAVFAKIGMMTREDPDFISSRAPSLGRRVQIMVRNKIRYATTNGWGYAMFLVNGVILADPDPNNKKAPGIKQAEACDACHQVVKDRGYVFSSPVDFTVPVGADNSVLADGVQKLTPPAPPEALLSFADVLRKDLPPDLAAILPSKTDKIRSVEGAMRIHSFDGTLNELRPALLKESIRTELPALFLTNADENFIMIVPAPNGTQSLADARGSVNPQAPVAPLSTCPEGTKKYDIFSRYYIPLPQQDAPFLNIPHSDSNMPRTAPCDDKSAACNNISHEFFCQTETATK